MKTIRRSAVILFSVLAVGIPTAASASTFQSATWALLSNRIGQFRLFNRQPKKDPFNDAAASVDQLMNEKKQQANEHLRIAREALKQGNLTAASFHHDRAVAMNVKYAAGEYSPDRLAEDIKRSRGQNASSLQTAAPSQRLPAAARSSAPAPTPAASANYPNTGPRYADIQIGAVPAGRSNIGVPTYIDPQIQPATGASGKSGVGQAFYDSSQDTTYNRQVTGSAPNPSSSDLRFLSSPPAGSRPAASTPPAPYSSPPLAIGQPSAARDKPPAVSTIPATPSSNYQIPPVRPAHHELSSNRPDTNENPPFELSRPTSRHAIKGPILTEPTSVAQPPVAPSIRSVMSRTRTPTQTAPPNSTLSTVAQNTPVPPAPIPAAVTPGGERLIDQASQAEIRLKKQVMAEVARQSRQALDMRDKDPVGAVGQLQKTRAMVDASSLAGADRQVLLNRVDRMLSELEAHVERHRAEIELNDHNQQLLDDLARKRDFRVEVDERLALLVDEYNKLRNEQRFYEAEVKAKEARLLAPDKPVVVQMFEEIRFHRRVANNENLREDKEEAVWASFNEVEHDAVPFGDESDPIRYHGEWAQLSARRATYAGDADRKRHPAELEIDRKLNTPVSLKFNDAPLSEVILHMKKVVDINIFLDPQGLAEEGVHPSTPVTIDLSQQISLRSALNLILAPLHLSYVIKNEVLKITSEQLRDRTVYPKTYNVADLVIPIPDFVPHNRLGMPMALEEGYQRTNQNLSGAAGFQQPIMSVANHTGIPGLATPAGTLAQQSSGFGSGGQPGGTTNADFDALIELITKTIDPESWDEVGGPGSIAEFETNLSLVISQTQEVHEKIADLLVQLRRLQDLQVTIEVRFITLTDNFFEQIGIDFDFNIDDNVIEGNVNNLPPDDGGPSTTIGLDPFGQITSVNPFAPYGPGDIQVRQGSFASVMPAFGGFTPAAATTFGVAILSDIEAYFLVQAAQGDTRSNILQSPKVTLFNGQAASISDQVQQPFVTSVTPVVGDFAAAQAPVIVVLAEGTTLSVQAVVSPDRRYVRLTLIPFFSEIRDVTEFTFEGSTTSTNNQTDSNQDDGNGNVATSATNNASNFTQGTTIQLPTFAFTTVTTTVSVPDGGTVLLGGVKRLREQRSEVGTPFLSKLPYISRLFKNVGVGREASSLMLMVTPRIIIQEEEEDKLGLVLP